jgi:ECF sigma factor
VTAVDSAEITRLLKAWDSGDKAALERLIPKVYDELRRMARRYMKKERAGHTLQTTALIMRFTFGWWTSTTWGGRTVPIFSRSRPG